MLFDWKQTSNFSLNFQYILYSHPLCALLCFVQLRVLFQYFVHQQGFYFQGFDRSLSFYSAYLVTGHNVSHLKHFLITVLSFDVQEATSRTKKTEADIYSMFLPKEIKRLCFVKCTWSHSFIYAITCLSFETSLISNRIHGERKALKCISFSHYLVSTKPSPQSKLFWHFRSLQTLHLVKVDHPWLPPLSSLTINSHFSSQSYHSTFLRRWQWPQHRPHLAVLSVTFRPASRGGANKQRGQEREEL